MLTSRSSTSKPPCKVDVQEWEGQMHVSGVMVGRWSTGIKAELQKGLGDRALQFNNPCALCMCVEAAHTPCLHGPTSDATTALHLLLKHTSNPTAHTPARWGTGSALWGAGGPLCSDPASGWCGRWPAAAQPPQQGCIRCWAGGLDTAGLGCWCPRLRTWSSVLSLSTRSLPRIEAAAWHTYKEAATQLTLTHPHPPPESAPGLCWWPAPHHPAAS